jgi:hypothetical protein
MVVTTVITKSTVFWDVAPCRPVKPTKHEGAVYIISFEENATQETSNKQTKNSASSFLAWLAFWPWKWRSTLLRNFDRFTPDYMAFLPEDSNLIHVLDRYSIIHTLLLRMAAVRTSHPAKRLWFTNLLNISIFIQWRRDQWHVQFR